MNKKKIVEELNEWAEKELGSEFKVTLSCDAPTLFLDGEALDGEAIAWFPHSRKDRFKFASSIDQCTNVELIQKNVINKFYEKGVELLTKHEPKYTVQVFPQDRGYLSVNHESKTSNDVTYDIGWPEDMYYLVQTQFTQSEIEELKKRNDIAIDWNKAIIKEVKENEND